MFALNIYTTPKYLAYDLKLDIHNVMTREMINYKIITSFHNDEFTNRAE